MVDVDFQAVKAESEKAVLAWGGRINQWLPVIGAEDVRPRDPADAGRRCAALRPMTAVADGMPCGLALEWLRSSGCEAGLIAQELAFLSDSRGATMDQRQAFEMHREALWAAAWAGGMSDDLSPVR